MSRASTPGWSAARPSRRLLQDAFVAAAEDSEPGLVTIVGDAGIGKSRLLEEFETWLDLRPEEVLYLRGRARPGTENDAFSSMRDVVADRFEILDTDAPEAVQAKLSAGFGESDPDPVDEAGSGAGQRSSVTSSGSSSGRRHRRATSRPKPCTSWGRTRWSSGSVRSPPCGRW